MAFKLHGSVCSDLDEIKDFINDILDRLDTVVEDENLMFDIKLILNELIINGVIHGNRCNRKKCIDLYLEIIDDAVRIEVKDQGKGIDCNAGIYDPEELKVCGRGLVIVDGLSDEMYIDKNRIVAVKYMV
ncbi:MAG: ATP-binding protein [Tissierellia bacterium]|nr:ATP-binding protein [Tissierellia bacterium]